MVGVYMGFLEGYIWRGIYGIFGGVYMEFLEGYIWICKGKIHIYPSPKSIESSKNVGVYMDL